MIREGRENRKTFLAIQNMDQVSRRVMRQGWQRFGKDLRDEASKEILRKPKSGRTYIRRDRAGRRRRHIASAPGETHANRTGATRRGLSWKVRGSTEMEFGYGVIHQRPATAWSGFLEFGTMKMEPRPSLQNAIAARTRTALNHFESSLTKDLNK